MDVSNQGNLGEWACFSLGANLGKRKEKLEEAMAGLEEALGNAGRRSSMYESPPWGFESNHPFLNCCIAIPCQLAPEEIFRRVREVESGLGRKRGKGSASMGEGYSDRHIDIDFLLYGKHILTGPELVLPHPRMHLRRFVLQPLVEIDPGLPHPVLGRNVGELLEGCSDASLLKVL